MPSRVTRPLPALLLLAACALLGRAQNPPEPAPPPRPLATLELVLPAGATATVDGFELGSLRTTAVGNLKPSDPRRVKVAVTFADGATDERLVDLTSGQRLTVPIPNVGPDKPVTVPTQPLTPVTAAALSRDGRYIAVGLEDRAVVLWDTASGRPVRTLAGHQGAVLSVCFSSDGRHILSGSADFTAILWDTETGARVRTFKGHTGSVASVALSPDGERCLTGSHDSTATLWKTQTAERVHTLKSTKEVLAVAYSPDGTTLATASADTTAALWEATTGKQVTVLKGHKEGVSCICFSPDGSRVGTGSFENFGFVWEAATGKRLMSTTRHNNDVYSIAFTADGRRLLTGDREEMVTMWDASTGTNLRTFPGHNADVVSLVARPDGRVLVTGSRDGTVKLWDLATGRELLTLTTDAARKTWAVVAPDGLFDASEAGRRVLGFRFAKLPGAEIDQFFRAGFRPGLLAEVWRGERPIALKPIARSKPPLVRIVGEKRQTVASATATVAVDVTDLGGGMSGLVVENNGVRLALATKSEPAPGGKAARITFTVPLAPGVNKVRVRASSGDGSWESVPADVELTHPRTPGQRGRMYVVAIGVGNYAEKGLNFAPPAKDTRALAELLQARGKDYDRVDVVPVYDLAATKTTIEDTVKDVAELSRPQDAVVVLLCGHGALVGDRLYFAPHDLRIGADRPEDALRTRGIAVDDLAAALGTAAALRRALVVDTSASGVGRVLKGRSEFALRGVVERWARSHGVHTLAVATERAGEQPEPRRGLLGHALDAARGAEGALDVTDWFRSVAERAGPHHNVQVSSQARGFPVLAPVK
jgi:WD40 repeat protein